jgi:hypothetical protein
VFRTRKDRQPTNKFLAACPCPDGLMQDGTQEGNVAYVISHRGARSRGYKRRETARARARERERVPACLCLNVNVLCQRVSPSVLDVQRARVSTTSLRKALDIPFYRYKEMPSCTMGCSCELTWPSEKCFEPCRSTAVGVAWILLTLSCFRRRLRAIRCHGRTRGTIITCYRSNLRWDTSLVPSLPEAAS